MFVFKADSQNGHVQPLLGLTRHVEKDYSSEILWGMALVLLAIFVYLLVTPGSMGRLIGFLAASFLPLMTSLGLAMNCYDMMCQHLGSLGMADPESRFRGLWHMALMVRLGAGITAGALLATAIVAWLGKKGGSEDPRESDRE